MLRVTPCDPLTHAAASPPVTRSPTSHAAASRGRLKHSSTLTNTRQRWSSWRSSCKAQGSKYESVGMGGGMGCVYGGLDEGVCMCVGGKGWLGEGVCTCGGGGEGALSMVCVC